MNESTAAEITANVHWFELPVEFCIPGVANIKRYRTGYTETIRLFLANGVRARDNTAEGLDQDKVAKVLTDMAKLSTLQMAVNGVTQYRRELQFGDVTMQAVLLLGIRVPDYTEPPFVLGENSSPDLVMPNVEEDGLAEGIAVSVLCSLSEVPAAEAFFMQQTVEV